MESPGTVTERARWAGDDLGSEYRTILELARRPVSLVEIGAVLAVPVAVARILVGDLVGDGYLDVHARCPPQASWTGGRTAANSARNRSTMAISSASRWCAGARQVSCATRPRRLEISFSAAMISSMPCIQ